jgi:hypothetical protein
MAQFAANTPGFDATSATGATEVAQNQQLQQSIAAAWHPTT